MRAGPMHGIGAHRDARRPFAVMTRMKTALLHLRPRLRPRVARRRGHQRAGRPAPPAADRHPIGRRARSAGANAPRPVRAAPGRLRHRHRPGRQRGARRRRRRCARRWPSTRPSTPDRRRGASARRRRASRSSSATSRRSRSRSRRGSACRRVAIGNFTVGLDLRGAPRHSRVEAAGLLPRLRHAYARATLALELPFAGGFDVFPARPPHAPHRPAADPRPRDDARALRSAAPPARRAAVVRRLRPAVRSTSTASTASTPGPWSTTDRSAPSATHGSRHRVVHRGDACSLPPASGTRTWSRPSDVVVTKPGYGIIAGVHRDRHGDALHVARRVPRVRPARRRDAALRALPVHQSGGSVRRPLAGGARRPSQPHRLHRNAWRRTARRSPRASCGSSWTASRPTPPAQHERRREVPQRRTCARRAAPGARSGRGGRRSPAAERSRARTGTS